MDGIAVTKLALALDAVESWPQYRFSEGWLFSYLTDLNKKRNDEATKT